MSPVPAHVSSTTIGLEVGQLRRENSSIEFTLYIDSNKIVLHGPTLVNSHVRSQHVDDLHK